jgi:iron complex outermembrane recepter protein
MFCRVTRGRLRATLTHRVQLHISGKLLGIVVATLASLALCASSHVSAQAAQKQSPARVALAKKPPNLGRVAQASTPQLRAFDIAPQALDGALTAFSAQARVQVLVAGELTVGLGSPGVSGTYTPEEAMRQLLANTGLKYRFTAPTTVTLERLTPQRGAEPQVAGTGEVPRAPAGGVLPAEPITVQEQRPAETAYGPVKGYVATRSATGTKTDTPLIETPQSISVVTRDQMDAQAAQTVQSALRYSSGVALYEKNDNRFDINMARGFDLEEFLDGMRLLGGSFATPRIDPYFLERIEVFKGPPSVLYGQAPPGGLVNLVSKRPTLEPFHEILFQTGSYERLQAAFDVSGPIDRDGQFLYRLTALGRDTETQTDFVKDQRFAIMPALTWRPTPDTTLTLLTSYQNDPVGGFINSWPAQGTVLSNPNGEIPTNLYGGAPNFDKHKREQYYVGYLFEHRFSDVWTVRQNFRYMHINDDYFQVLSGDFEPDLRTLTRSVFTNVEDFDAITLDNQVQSKFATGPLQHMFVFGIDYQRSMQDFKFGSGEAPSLDILSPDYSQPIQTPPLFFDDDRTRNQIGLYAQDQLKLGPWVLLLGGRHDWADRKIEDRLANMTTKQSDSDFTWRAGLLHLFDIGLAPYFSYAESFEPTIGTDFEGKLFEPTTGKQYEIGIKYQPQQVNALISLSLFQLTQQNVLTPDPDPEHAFFSVQTGEIRARGIELEGKASLMAGLNLTAAYTYVDAEVTKSNDVDLGKRPVTIPSHLASVWGDYTIQGGTLAGLGFGAGVRYFGSTYGDAENTLKVSDYTLADAALHYDMAGLGVDALKGVRLGVNASNLFDKEYVAFCANPGACHYGLRRTVLGTFSYRW